MQISFGINILDSVDDPLFINKLCTIYTGLLIQFVSRIQSLNLGILIYRLIPLSYHDKLSVSNTINLKLEKELSEFVYILYDS
ncbi:hypothetical protein BpHYR1_021754 [Brachionus plicatilis]|uniref:Uncharacterized protein n=1 Tax=Brachionus plicatilis TaxID=10195 RepID=A0A3M7T2I6_BRAPC|nr:hypothetical protein BpHYR1_021754 [Brachionus plicatilis]